MHRHKRCGCDCKNPTTFEVCEGRVHIPCCEHCEAAASAYAILWECCLTCNPLMHLPRHMLVWKDCLFDCLWRSRTTSSETSETITPEGGLTSVLCDILQYNPDVAIPSFPIEFAGCYPFPMSPGGDDTRAAYFDMYNMGSPADHADFIENHTNIHAELEITGAGTAELRLISRGGVIPIDDVAATYICNDFNCLDRSTFHRVTTDEYPLITNTPDPRRCYHLPNHVCVTPAVSQWRTPCDPPSAACACCDNGADGGYLDVNLGDCGGEHEVEIVRNAELPSGVTDPEAPCGYFWGTISTDCDFTFGVLTYCDGEDWHVDLWCSLDGWHEIDTATATLTQCCPGAAYTWTWSGDWGDCCCTETPDPVECACCPDDLAPANYLVTIPAGTTNGTCTDCSGITGSHILTPAGGACNWTKELTPPVDCGGGLSYSLISLQLSDNFSGGCLATLSIAADDGNLFVTWVSASITDCFDLNDLDKDQDTGKCATLPATITVEPA